MFIASPFLPGCVTEFSASAPHFSSLLQSSAPIFPLTLPWFWHRYFAKSVPYPLLGASISPLKRWSLIWYTQLMPGLRYLPLYGWKPPWSVCCFFSYGGIGVCEPMEPISPSCNFRIIYFLLISIRY